jgi:exonuclease SbcD
MRIGHFSDLHLTDGPRLADAFDTFLGCLDDLEAFSPDLVLVTGDLTGRTVPHRSTPAERGALYPCVVRLARMAPVVVLLGNHDHAEDLVALEHLDGSYPIRVVVGPERLDVSTRAGEARLWCLPYPHRRGRLGEGPAIAVADGRAELRARIDALLATWAEEMISSRAQAPTVPVLLLAHLTVAGARVAGGEVLHEQEVEATRERLASMPIDYGALGHLHLRQEAAPRCWYPGTITRNDFSETDPKGWHAVEIAPHLDEIALDLGTVGKQGFEEMDRLAYTVRHMPSPCRDFVTLRWAWGMDADERLTWEARPTDAELGTCRDAEVRMRLDVAETWVGSVPWEAEIARVRRAGAVRIAEDHRVAPVERARSPLVAAATSPEAKLRAFWATLDPPPDPVAQSAALDLLARLAL